MCLKCLLDNISSLKAPFSSQVTELQDEVRELRRLVDETERVKNIETQKLLAEIQMLQQLTCARPSKFSLAQL